MMMSTEPKGTPVERNRISSSDYRKKNPEKAKTSARLSNFRARARKKGLTSDAEVEEAVSKWEREWQDKQAKEASEVIPLSPQLCYSLTNDYHSTSPAFSSLPSSKLTRRFNGRFSSFGFMLVIRKLVFF